jgi:hypothetical protein
MSTGAPRRRVPLASLLLAALTAFGLGGCASIEGARADAKKNLVENSRAMAQPQRLATRYTAALEQFGRVLEVYRASAKSPLYVQTRSITDSTGLSHPLVGAELPTDITEMVRSAINRIGDRVVYVPFHPDYVMGHAQQGAKLQLTQPHVLITGAITEFDRALASAGRGNDAGIFFGKGRGETDAAASRRATSTISRLSVDFNLVDFQTQTMLPRVQTTNSMRVLNESFEDAYDFAIYGNGFGVNSNTRYLQGRHNAIRLLVDLSIVQLLGRHTNVPYWRCIPGAVPDPVVLERIRKGYLANDSATKVKWLQDTLKDYGFGLEVNGRMDTRTRAALESVVGMLKLQPPADLLDADLFTSVYVNIPVEPVGPARAL